MDLKIFKDLYFNTFHEKPGHIESLPPSGSHRKYFRIVNPVRSVIGVYNEDIPENRAFLQFTRHFNQKELRVPELFAVYENEQYYLISDLGNLHLKDLVEKYHSGKISLETIESFYHQVLTELLSFQFEGHKGMDYSFCIPRDSFDRQSILWDLNHFKYFFLKISGIPFNEQELENDFQEFATDLVKAKSDHFMFRDFQSRNIMIKDDQCYFIDYQGGRKGALQYDVASLLFEAKTNLPFKLRDKLLNQYLGQLEHYEVNPEKYMDHYYSFVLIRILQALGAYGLRGWVEKKALFLQSIPYALKNIKWLIVNNKISYSLKELTRILEVMIDHPSLDFKIPSVKDKLRIEINSFSYKKSLPNDLSGNGGGFVFDCRAINNPGRYEAFRPLTGKDKKVIDFFEENNQMDEFIEEAKKIVARSIESYLQQSYKNLQINFGCTGGRHRSVYAAEKLAEYLKQNEHLIVVLQHKEIKS